MVSGTTSWKHIRTGERPHIVIETRVAFAVVCPRESDKRAQCDRIVPHTSMYGPPRLHANDTVDLKDPAEFDVKHKLRAKATPAVSKHLALIELVY